MTKLKKYKLNDVIEKERGISYGIVQPGQFVNDGIPVIKINNITEGKTSMKDVQKVKPEIERKYLRTRLKGNEILISLVGSLGFTKLVTKHMIGWNVVRAIGVLPIHENFDKEWIYWFLKSPQAQAYVINSASTSVQATLNLKELQELEIEYPNRSYRNKAVAILTSLDDKIELNRRMNHTLEQIGQAIFKEWFIHFDFPNENRNPYKSSGGKILLTEFDERPTLWESKNIYELANYINGAAYKNVHFTTSADALPIVKIVELKYGITQTTKFTNTNLGEKYKINNGDILFSWSGSPETSIDTFLWVKGSAWLNQHIFKVVTETLEKRTYIYFLLKYLKPIFIDIAKNKQTTGLGHVTISDLKELMVAYPSPSTLLSFSSVVTPLLNNIENNLNQINSLFNIRDTLLPKLMSGEIDLTPTPTTLHESIPS